MADMNQVRFRLNIPADRFLAYYRGEARSVVARSLDGRTISFPASALQKHVTRQGIHGEFLLVFDDENRFVELVRVARS